MRQIVKSLAVSVLLLGGGNFASSIPARADDGGIVSASQDYGLRFRTNSSVVDPAFAGNAAALDSLRHLLGTIAADSLATLENIEVSSSSSPEGPLKHNLDLARRRMESIAGYIVANCGIDRSLVSYGKCGVPWDEFRASLRALGTPDAAELAAIAAEGSDDSPADVARRMARLKKHTASWRIIARDILPTLRGCSLLTLRVRRPAEEPAPVPEPAPEPVVEVVETVVPVDTVVEVIPEPAPAVEPVAAMPADTLYWRISTDLPAYFLLIANVAGERDLAPHWSMKFSLYYSGWNYFKSKIKFRTVALMPEARYWLRPDRKGLFVNAHLGVAWYNYAKNREHRYQDHNKAVPAYGGGLGLGYRFNFCRNSRWSMEAGVGAGVYRLDYDIFINRHNGPRIDRRKRTLFCLDQALFSITYRFDSGKPKGGDR